MVVMVVMGRGERHPCSESGLKIQQRADSRHARYILMRRGDWYCRKSLNYLWSWLESWAGLALNSDHVTSRWPWRCHLNLASFSSHSCHKLMESISLSGFCSSLCNSREKGRAQFLKEWHCSSLHGKYIGKQWKQWETLFSWAPKSLQMVTAAMKLKDACSLKEKLWPT